MQLQPFNAAPAGVQAVAWSADGHQLAFAVGDQVTVTDWASRQSFGAAIPVSVHRTATPLIHMCPHYRICWLHPQSDML